MRVPLRVLIVEDSPDDTALLIRELRRAGYRPVYERVDAPETLSDALDRQEWDLVIVDYSMPRFTGAAALAMLRERGLDAPFIFVSGTIGEDTAVAAMKVGASDYIMKGNLKRLVPAIERELKEADLRRQRKQAEEKIQYLAYYDALTGLPNRILFHDRLKRAILARQPENKRPAVLRMDLDHFREVNDRLGHPNGDVLLQQVARRLTQVLRVSDTVARLGGDEFVMLLPCAGGADDAIVTARKILKALEDSFILLERLIVEVRASIGIALCPDHGEDPDLLLQRADVAMNMAKNSHSGFALYAPQLDCHTPQRLALMGELRQAMERNQLVLCYQPKVHIRARRVVGLEILVQWQHPQQGMVPPDQLIDLAEQTGLIRPLTLWVLGVALRQCQMWHRAGLGLSVAVNLSGRNLQDPRLVDQVSESLQACGVAPGWLELEITESTLMADPARAMDLLTRLSKMGVRLSLEDFGTGYSSLSYLQKLPVDEAKIDRSFVMNMGVRDDAVIVRSIIDLAHNLGLQVVAEGVESRDIWDKLAALGCDAAQGYYISRPIPAVELTRWHNESPWGTGKFGKTIRAERKSKTR